MKTRVHAAGSGIISAIGNSVRDTWEALRQSRSGIGELTLFESIHQASLPVGEVKLSDELLSHKLAVSPDFPRAALLGLHAVREAVANSGIDLHRWRTGLISATTVGGMDRTEKFFPRFIGSPNDGKLRNVIHHGCGKTAELIARATGIGDYITTINTACSSSANAIALGARMIAAGLLDIAVAGGTDSLTQFTLNGFNSLMILDKQPCRPFDAERNGLNLGEGAGYLVLVSEKVLDAEGRNSSGRLTGFGNTNDAFHQTASSPDGRGSFDAMQQALTMSGIRPGGIDYINLHGTGTSNNDLSEGTALRRLFGESIPKVSSTKAYTGHTLGASGGIEAVISLMAIERQCVFPNLRFKTPMPETAIQPQAEFEEGVPIRHVMSNSFGFGGNCSSLIFSKNNPA